MGAEGLIIAKVVLSDHLLTAYKKAPQGKQSAETLGSEIRRLTKDPPSNGNVRALYIVEPSPYVRMLVPM